MKIAYVHLDSRELMIGSYNVQEIGFARAFSELGHTVYLVYWVAKDDIRCNTEVAFSENIIQLFLPYKLRLAHHVMTNMALLKPYEIDIHHLQCDNLLFVSEAVKYCRQNNLEYYCYIGTIKSSSKNRASRAVMDLASKRNLRALRRSLVFAKTLAMTDELLALGVEQARFAPVGLDLSVIPTQDITKAELVNKLGLPPDKIIICCVAALRQDKHPFDIFEVAERLDEGYHIVYIGGDGPLKAGFLKKLIEKKEYSKIEFLGTLPYELIHSYYQVADYYINFNTNEIFGMAVLEAMYHDCNVVAIKAPGPNSIIENDISGFLVDSIGEMCDVITQNVTVNNARKRIVDEFTWSKMVSIVLAQFDVRS